MLKIRVEEDGKSFEAFVKMLMIKPKQFEWEDERIVGMAIAGNTTACRAIHASAYSHSPFVVFDDETGEEKSYRPTGHYRRVEEINGKVCHMFLLPRLAIQDEYNQELIQAEQEEKPKPDRVIIASDGEVEKAAGRFLAHTYGLPRSEEWVAKYLSILPEEKWSEIRCETTPLMRDWQNVRAVHIHSMEEQEVLDAVQQAIHNNVLNVYSSIGGEAVFRKGMSTEDYLRENAETLAGHLDRYMTPQYDGSHFDRYIGETKRVSVPAQARVIMGALTVLKKQNSVFIVGDMGTGKTQISLTVIYSMMKQRTDSGAKDGLRVLIVAPAITIPKWATSEIPTVLGQYRQTTIVLSTTEDALAYVRKVRNGHKPPKNTIEFVLVSTDRMKLGASRHVLGARWNNRDHTWRCPDCGNPIMTPDAKAEDEFAGWRDAVSDPKNPPTEAEFSAARRTGNLEANGLPKSYVKKWNNKIRRFQCNNCTPEGKQNRSLTRPALKQRGEDKMKNRWMIAQIFQRMLPNHFHVGIFDEIQQMKASDSGRGVAFHKILKSCRKAMFLTGTLTNGAASSIQATLWRSDPKSLLDEGFTHATTAEKWAYKYGVLERVTHRDDEGVTGVTTNRRKERVIIKEKPGIAPQLTANHLLHKSVFIELSDLGLPLVKLKEIPVIVDLEEEHAEAYQTFHRDLYNTCRDMQQELGTVAWSRFNPATLNYADQPQLGQEIEFRARDGGLLRSVTAPDFSEDYLTSKDKKMVEIVQRELAEGRGCLIFTNFTGYYRTNERVQKVLYRHGISSEILDTKTTPLRRFEWLEEQRRKGTKVLIMNMSLVQVGLDIVNWPTILYYQLNDDINVIRQSSRRGWRLGQSKECRVYFLVNGGTQQFNQFQRLMSRRINAMLVEGRIERSDSLAKYAQDDMSHLERDLSKSLAASELADKWRSAAEKDVDKELEMVEESELKARIKEAFTELTAETKRLCGIPVDTAKLKEAKEVEVAAEPASVSTAMEQIDLFDYLEQFTVEKVQIKRRGKPVQEVEQMTIAL